MTLDRYAALRLEIDYGFCQNQISNEQISINIRYWEYNFLESQINKIGSKNHIGSIVAFLEGYKLGFFINFVNTPNVSGGLIGLRVMGAGNAIAITNQVESLEWSNANYIPGTNFKELIMNIPANSSLLASNYTANQQLFNTQQLIPPPANSVPINSESGSYSPEFAKNTEIQDNASHPVNLDRLTRAVEHLCTKYPDDETLKQILTTEVHTS